MNKVVIFDFDGVIVGTFDFCFKISKINTPDLTEDEYRERFEGNINEAIKKIEQKQELKISGQEFFEKYEIEIAKKSLIPGIDNIIKSLAGKYDLFIVSSTNTDVIKRFLERHNLFPEFKKILGNDIHHSKVEKINMVLQEVGVKSEDCIMITDTLGDIKEASQCGVKSIAVTWGYHSTEILMKGSPFKVVNTPQEIIKVIDL